MMPKMSSRLGSGRMGPGGDSRKVDHTSKMSWMMLGLTGMRRKDLMKLLMGRDHVGLALIRAPTSR